MQSSRKYCLNSYILSFLATMLLFMFQTVQPMQLAYSITYSRISALDYGAFLVRFLLLLYFFVFNFFHNIFIPSSLLCTDMDVEFFLFYVTRG